MLKLKLYEAEVVAVYTIKACRGSGGTVPFIFTVLDAGEWLHTRSGSFIVGRETHYSLYRRLGGLQIRSGRFGKDKSLFTLPEFEPRVVQPVA